jgi:hypothetical protein
MIPEECPPMRIDHLLTRNALTGAVRHITDDLLAEVYLAPRKEAPDLADHLTGRNAPWSQSFAAAPEETARAVEAGLVTVARATPTLDPEALAPSALPDGRARTHLTALRDLWRDVANLPGPLAIWAHVLRSPAAQALEPLPLLDPTLCAFADPAETALAETLQAHHGAAPAPALATWAARHPTRQGAGQSALGQIQDKLGRGSEATTPDDTVTCYGLRDPREEMDFAAACARRMLDDGIVDTPQEIGLLVPDDPAYQLGLGEAFDRIGLPLSGLPAGPILRDVTGELLSLLLVLLQGPTPRTALASLYISPLMPWSTETGRQMARQVMDRGWSRTASECSGPAHEILDALRPCTTPEQLFARLGAVARAAPNAGLHPRIAALRTVTHEGLDWPLLRRLAASQVVGAPGQDRFVEGVSLFTETAMPWRPVSQLIVLGMAGRHWPRLPGSDPFFTEGEVALIRDATGLALPGRRKKLARGLELFRRQLCAATEGLTLLVPAMDLRGDRLSASTGLALIAHMLGAEEPFDLLQDIRAAQQDSWPVAVQKPDPVPMGGAPDLPADGILLLNRGLGTPDKPGLDLLRLREDAEGDPVPQSPSRLETLLVSPFAWLLDELGAKDRTWAPEALDVMTLGTILHQVLEDSFPEGTPVPAPDALSATVPQALDAAIRSHAAWLTGPSWATERRSLLREAQEVVTAWASFLTATGAEILHNEIALKGDHGGLLLHGKADCLLRMPDGRILVVDHKRSSSANRRDRMAKGWDLQVALYRAMLERPAEETALTRLAAKGAQVVTAYHTMLDSTVLSDAAGAGVPRIEAAGANASAHAMTELAALVTEVGAGTIRLNRAGDSKNFEKDRGIKAYALADNAFVAAFMLPEEDIE